MASSSSSTAMASSSSDEASSYDVFLSFRGEDTRHSFTDHLYHKLIQAGISTFRDDEEIKRGEQLKPEIERAIKASRASIVVLSENYATSAWCLDELLLILQQRRECNHFVLPVFYHVKPTDVRNQNGSFAIKVIPSSRWTDHNVSEWKTALVEVANLAGQVASGPETSILKEIVDTIYNKLDRKHVHLPPNMTGIATRYEEISSWLDQCNLEFLSICGMGGSGKTTLAKYIYDINSKSFEYTSFVENIGSRCDLHELQEQLLKDMLGGENRKVPCVSRGTCMIEEALEMKRALIVLDDIVKHKQLVALLGTGKINAQTKIIITTRENTDNWFDMSYWRCQKYEMKLLNGDESSELLCHHAFRSKSPKPGFQDVVLRAVQYCEGNPLALEVLGSSLYKNDSISYWESLLNSFARDVDSRIQDVLLRSYAELPSDTVKGLFLHMACFFVGIDKDYVVNILEPDYSAISGITVLINKCLLSVSPNKVLLMHRLVQEMGKHIVRQESQKIPAKRSRVWLSIDSYKILSKGKGSKTVEGLALDMKLLSEENFALKASYLKTDAFKKMENLKLLQLNFAELRGSYKYVSEDLRWLCWHGFPLETVPTDLCIENLVAIDMSYSNLDVFEPPTVIQSLKILNLKDSHKLTEIRNISRIPNLETIILWNCYSLVNVCESLGALSSLTLLNMTGCKNQFSWEHTKQPTFSFPFSLHRLFLKDCNLECADFFPLSFSVQLDLQYLNLGNSRFESLPCYAHLENLRVLDLSFCSRLKCLVCLPSKLAELYIYYCGSLESITFESHQFPLQEFGYEGCNSLYEVEGFFKLVPIAKLDGTDLGHMKWLKAYQNYEVRLVGDDELTVGRSWQIQMLYEFSIISTSLPDIKDPNMTAEYISESTSLSFDVPSCPNNKRLEGINVIFKYSVSGDDVAWFCKISTASGGVDLMYNPRVFGKPEFGEVCMWLSYWPIGNTVDSGDTVNVSIVAMVGLEVHECGVSLVYSDKEIMENNMEWEDIMGGDMSRFQLSTGAYYLCRRDFFSLMEVGRLTCDWFRILVGETIDYTEVRGWRKMGRPKQVNDPSFTELKTVRCIIHGPQLEDIYKIAEMSKTSIGDKTMALTSSVLESGMKSGTKSELTDKTVEEINEIMVDEFDPYPPGREMDSATEMGKKPSLSTLAHPCRHFSFEEIRTATKNFADELILEKCVFGNMYKGQISSDEGSHIVAIQQLVFVSYPYDYERDQLKAKIEMLCTLRYRHLVSLIGYCDDSKTLLLVYEYTPNGSLYHHLHKANTNLSWVTRLKIAIGAARGLDYLHTGAGTQLVFIHGELNSTLVLLDEKWEAMITGVGWRQLYQGTSLIYQGNDTLGYLDPENFSTGRPTKNSDVFSFGVVLFELLSGRCVGDRFYGVDPDSLILWAQQCLKEGNLDQMVDPSIKGTISTKCLRQFTKMAYRCLHSEPKKRPTMSEVVASLTAILELQKKSNSSAESSSIMGFPRRIYEYFVPATKPDSDESGTSSQKSREKNKQQQDEEMDSATGMGKKPSLSTLAHPCRHFSFEEIRTATKNFANELILEKRVFGNMYKGQISSDEGSFIVAIQQLDFESYPYERDQLKAKIEMLCTLRYRHLVSLIGYCDDSENMLLVCEYTPNGSLFHHLHEANTPLSWVTRLKIAIGAARGLDYLHTDAGTQLVFIHGEVNSTHVLLDEKWEAMITGFGWRQLSQRTSLSFSSTMGYLDPEYFLTGRLTRKSDVFSFGVVLFELLSGRRVGDRFYGVDPDSLIRRAQQCLKEGKLDQMVDPSIKGTISTKCLSRFTQMAYHCLDSESEKRPTMSELVSSLTAILELQKKSNSSAESSSIMGFPPIIYEYSVPATKPDSDESGTSSQKSREKNKKQQQDE